MRSADTRTTGFFLSVLIAIAISSVGCYPKEGGDPTDPIDNTTMTASEQAAYDGTFVGARLTADALEDAASRLESGELKTDRDMVDFLSEATKKARVVSMRPAMLVHQKENSGETWTAVKAASLLRKEAAGLRRAAECRK